MRSLARWALGLVGLLLLTLILAWIILPRWLQGSGAKLASEALGRELTMAEVRFEPWRLGLVVDGLRIAGAAGSAEPLLSVGRIDAALSLRSLWFRAPVLSSLSVDQPELRVAHLKDGHYDIDDLLVRFAAKPKDDHAAADPPDWAVYNIRLNGGRVLLDDRMAGREHELGDLRLQLPFLSTLDAHVKQQVLPHVSGRINGAAFGSEAQLLPFAASPEATLDFKLNGLDLAPYAPYLPADVPLRLQRGLADATLALKFGPAARLQISGDLALRDGAVQTRKGAPLLAWQELRVALKDVQPLRRQVQLGAIRWQGVDATARLDALPPAPKGPAAKPAAPWRFGFDSFELTDAALDAREAAGLQAKDLSLKLGATQWPLRAAVPVSYALRLNDAARIEGAGSVAAEALKLDARAQAVELAWFARHLPQPLAGQVDGRLELSLARPLEPDPAARAQLQLRELTARKLRLAEARADIGELRLDELKLDLGARTLSLGELGLVRPSLHLERAADGAWKLPASAQGDRGSAAPAWQAQLRGLRVEGGALQLKDGVTGTELGAEQIKLRLQNLAWPARPEAAPLPVSLSLRVVPTRASARRSAEAGVMDWQGHLALAPLSASGRLRIERLGLRPLVQPFLDPAWGVQLRRAELGLKGDFALKQGGDGAWQGQASGDLLLSDLRLNEAGEGGDNLLSWQSLHLDSLKLTLAPGASPLVEAATARLDDFHARLVINEQGRFNLGELGPKKSAKDEQADKTAAGEVSQPAPPLRVAIAQTVFSKGQVDFSDRFIRPNYSAELSALEGTLGAFATGRPDAAALQLRGLVAGTGALQVQGQLNPGRSPPVMDIKAEVSDIELAPLSPYAAKYAGYAIERGKLSSRVAYKIGSDGVLHADNQIVLQQLTFGDRVDSPSATNLPVRLAVALLKDSNGVIDVNLPVSGSINEPDFSVGGLIGRMLVNLLTKAVTAPFSLLFPGPSSEQLGAAAFAPGSSTLAEPAHLDKVAQALKERPALNLTITGWASERAEASALRERQLDDALLNERRRELRRQQPGKEPAQPGAPITLSEADRARLLKQLYEASTLPNRPRNVLGLLKDIPADEMRAMLLTSYVVGEQRLRELAVQRATAVRDALIAKGTPNARLFLATPRLTAADVAPGWHPHAELTLGLQ